MVPFPPTETKNFIQKLLPDTKESGRSETKMMDKHSPLMLWPALFTAQLLCKQAMRKCCHIYIHVIKTPQTLQMKNSSYCPPVSFLTVSVL